MTIKQIHNDRTLYNNDNNNNNKNNNMYYLSYHIHYTQTYKKSDIDVLTPNHKFIP